MAKKTTKSETTVKTDGERSVVSPAGGPLKPGEKRGSAKKHRRTKNPPSSGPAAPKAKRDVTPREESGDRELTFKERRFVVHYLCTGNATESARQAGYTGSDDVLATTGWRLLRKAEVLREIERRTESDTEDLMLSRKMYLRHLASIADGSITMEQAMPTGEGIATIRAQTPPRERLKALELMGKMRGFFLEKVLTSDSLADLIDSLPEE